MIESTDMNTRAATDQIVEHLAARWTEVDTAALFPAFALLARGRRPTAAQVAAAGGFDPERVARAFGSEGRLTVDDGGRLTELFGVSAEPWTYRIGTGDGADDLATCCALVAAVVPSLLEREITIVGSDPVTGRAVHWRLDADRTHSATPRQATATLVRTELEPLLANTFEHFCRHVRLFESPKTAERFAALEPRRFVVDLADLHRAARELYDAVWR